MANIFSRLNSAEVENTGRLAPAVLAYNAPRALTASAVRVNMKDMKELDAINKRRQKDKWQEEAWEYYDLIGELKYTAYLIASLTSRINLYVGYVEKTSNVPTDITDVQKLDPDFIQNANDILYLLESSNGGTAGILRNAALNLFVAGECWLVREPARYSTGEPSKYSIRSVEEIVATNSKKKQVAIKPRRDSKPSEYQLLPPDGYIARIWKNHARFSDEADSSFRGILDLCDQLLQLDRAAAAAAKSRMPAGMLFIPDGLSNMTEPDADMDAESADVTESFEEELIAGFMAPVEDITSGATLVPTIVRGPADLGEKIRPISFERSMDPQMNEKSTHIMSRILGGLDIPKDIASGMSSVKYANAVVIEEQLYKAHIEPMIMLIADSLTVGFLRPALRAQGWTEDMVSRAVVWYDPSAITAKPSKAEAAVTLYQMKLLGAEAVLRANGFAPEDGPSDLERVQRMAEERAILSDQMSETLLGTILPDDLKQSSRQEALANSDAASANALQNAVGGGDGQPAGGVPAPDGTSDTMGQESSTPAPPTLINPDQGNDQETEQPSDQAAAPAQKKTTAPPTLMEP